MRTARNMIRGNRADSLYADGLHRCDRFFFAHLEAEGVAVGKPSPVPFARHPVTRQGVPLVPARHLAGVIGYLAVTDLLVTGSRLGRQLTREGAKHLPCVGHTGGRPRAHRARRKAVHAGHLARGSPNRLPASTWEVEVRCVSLRGVLATQVPWRRIGDRHPRLGAFLSDRPHACASRVACALWRDRHARCSRSDVGVSLSADRPRRAHTSKAPETASRQGKASRDWRRAGVDARPRVVQACVATPNIRGDGCVSGHRAIGARVFDGCGQRRRHPSTSWKKNRHAREKGKGAMSGHRSRRRSSAADLAAAVLGSSSLGCARIQRGHTTYTPTSAVHDRSPIDGTTSTRRAGEFRSTLRASVFASNVRVPHCDGSTPWSGRSVPVP